jgi:uncharacterized repeat protein (TIGR01451 family)
MKIFISMVTLVCLPLAIAMAEPDIEVQKTVDNETPMPGEPVEFTILATNVGDQPAADVVIIDQLPNEMDIPAGTAAFPSVGSYDPVSGAWTIGHLDVGEAATLVVPAFVMDPEPPACIVNTARSELDDRFDDNNDEARAAIYSNSGDHCADVSASPDIRGGLGVFGVCDSRDSYRGTVDVLNSGPDTARDVVVFLTQTPVIGASIRFNDARCLEQGTAVCELAEVAPYNTLSLGITSDTFQNYENNDYRLTVAVSTSDIDYVSGNDFFETDAFVFGFSSCQPIDSGFGFGEVGPSYCFIATAAYGSPLDPHLDSLRGFRDRYLMTNSAGRAFVRFYYRHSPPLADFIAQHDWLRAIVRALLTPVVYAIENPVPATLIVVACGLLLFSCARRRKIARRRST